MSAKSADDMNDAVLRITGMSKRVFSEEVVSEARNSPEGRINPGPNHKAFAPTSLDQKIPKLKMAPQKITARAPGVEDYDSEPEDIGPVVKKENAMSVIKGTGLESMHEWRQLAGLSPMYEADNGWTDGVNKENKMKKGGLPGLQGTAVQEIDPNAGEDADHVGDPTYLTIGDAMTTLKKENIDLPALFIQFLEERGLTESLFGQLIDEAVESNDVAEMDAILGVEKIFFEDYLSEIFGFGKGKGNMSNLKAAIDAVAKHGMSSIVAAGGPPSKMKRNQRLKAAMAGNRNFHRYMNDPNSPGSDEEWEMECEDDGTGNPRMPWDNVMTKYGVKQ